MTANVTDNGYDSSTGVGIRLGYQGRLSDMVSIGAAYAPEQIAQQTGLTADQIKLLAREFVSAEPSLAVAGGISIDVSRMNRVLSIDAADLTVTVQPGVTPPQTFGTNTMQKVRAYHLISQSNDVWNCQYNAAFNDGLYRFEGALVVDVSPGSAAERAGRAAQEFQPLLAQALECIRAGARLEGSAAQQVATGPGDGLGGMHGQA